MRAIRVGKALLGRFVWLRWWERPGNVDGIRTSPRTAFEDVRAGFSVSGNQIVVTLVRIAFQPLANSHS